MDPATAVAGCGPAFVYQMIEAMADAGVGLGLSREQALQMAAQTFQGASQMVLETGSIQPACEMQFVAQVALPLQESIAWNKSAYGATSLLEWKQPINVPKKWDKRQRKE